MAVAREVSKKSPEQIVLENKKIIVQPINNIDRGFFKVGHDGNHTFSGCWKIYQLPMSRSTRAFVNPFNSKDEQYAFEELLGLESGELNPNNSKSKFWGEYTIRLDKEKTELDLSIVKDALTYRILSVDPKFAKEGQDVHSGQFEYKLLDERYQEEESNKAASKKDGAWEEYFRIKGDTQKLLDVLKLLGVKLSEETSLKTLQAKVVEIIDRVAKNNDPLIKNIDDFLRVVKDPKASIKLFVLDAIDGGEIRSFNGDYKLAENGELIAKSLEGAVEWFNDVNNKEVKMLIEQRLKNK